MPNISGGSGDVAPATSGAAPRRAGKDLAADFASACEPKIKAWRETAAALNIPQVTKATEQYITCIGYHQALFRTMAKFKKPADIGFIAQPY